MAVQTPTWSERFVIGPLVYRQCVLASVGNGDTMPTPFTRILFVDIAPTTATAVGNTVSGNTITFVSGGTFAATVGVLAREG